MVKRAIISDIHGNLEALKAVLEHIRGQGITEVFCLGDIIGYGPNPCECLDLVIQHSAVCILGNHDQFVDCEATRLALEAAGQTSLSGRWLLTHWNNAPVLLASNERPWFMELGNLAEASPQDDEPLPPRLFLLHSPAQIAWARENAADLVLAGHTHGAQVCLPVLGPVACPSLYGTRYTDGVYRAGHTVLHVTRGLSGMNPLRWLCPPEIALLELVQG